MVHHYYTYSVPNHPKMAYINPIRDLSEAVHALLSHVTPYSDSRGFPGSNWNKKWVEGVVIEFFENCTPIWRKVDWSISSSAQINELGNTISINIRQVKEGPPPPPSTIDGNYPFSVTTASGVITITLFWG